MEHEFIIHDEFAIDKELSQALSKGLKGWDADGSVLVQDNTVAIVNTLGRIMPSKFE